MENRPGDSMRKGLNPEQLAKIRKELDGFGGNLPTEECILTHEVKIVSELKFSELSRPADRIRHFKSCNFCGPIFRLALGTRKPR